MVTLKQRMKLIVPKLFDLFESYWESKRNYRNLSYILVAVFIVSLLIANLIHFPRIQLN